MAGRRARRVQALGLGRARGQRGGVLGGARELDADRVVGLLAHQASADEQLGQRRGEALVGRGGDQPGALADHLVRVGGAADDGDARCPEQRAQQ